MGQLDYGRTQARVLNRMFFALNQARTVKEIMELSTDDEDGERDYGIGEVVAKRILEKKYSLPYREFKIPEDLEDIQGFGQDKLDDLISIFSISTAELFRQSMYDGILYENFDLIHYTTYFNEDEFQILMKYDSALAGFVADQLMRIAQKDFELAWFTAKLGVSPLSQTYIEKPGTADYGSYAFAYWFYRFDSDNWFSFERVRERTSAYLSNGKQLELRLFKGYEYGGIVAKGITATDLPVVLSCDEQAVSIWTGALYD